MKPEDIDAFAAIPQPPRDQMGFLTDLRAPLVDYFAPGLGCPAGENAECFKNGFTLHLEYQHPEWLVTTALASLRRVLHDKNIPETADGYPITLVEKPGFTHEEYEVISAPSGAELHFGDSEGLRRAVYFYEDRLRECEGPAATPGQWRRQPYVKHRVSRCFFGPTNRAPFFIDELMNDVDYYPEAYLDKMAHEAINGVWLTMYFKDLPSSVFAGRGQDWPQRRAKLLKTVEKCAQYGIKIYVFLSEPKIWGSSSHCVPLQDAAGHPEVVGNKLNGDDYSFCTSSEEGQRYLIESVSQIFSGVPHLGGIINIMYGEDNGSCGHYMLRQIGACDCPRCRKLGAVRVLQEAAKIMTQAMKKAAPEAEYIGWFYAPGQRDGTAESRQLSSVADAWPEECGLMFNFESGGMIEQLGKTRTVFDYSLAYVGPSKLFREVAGKVKKMGAKLQVGCSHEDASVPFIPVPLNLYDKYRTLHDYQVYAVMQCWYFGNYPGLMNQAAGQLSFEPFCATGEEFLLQLARPGWKKFAPQAVQAWQWFSQSYRQFPGNIAFEWYGPLHYSIAWPWHLFPVDQPIQPSWLLKNFPEVSGDRVSECLGFHHTLPEALQLLKNMCRDWNMGLAQLSPLRKYFAHDSNRLADIALAEAVGLQMRSTRNMLEFYFLRNDMFYFRHDHLADMAELVRNEINATRQMLELCRQDPRLGYHSEAEGYLFFPAKLEARIALLEKLLAEDFPKFDLHAAWLDEFTGVKPTGAVAHAHRTGSRAADVYPCGDSGVQWSCSYDAEYLYVTIINGQGKRVQVEIEPARCGSFLCFGVDKNNHLEWFNFRQPVERSPQFVVTDQQVTIGVPQVIFDGYRQPGFPMRINVTADGVGWVKREPWSWRLYQQDSNPQCLGFLLID